MSYNYLEAENLENIHVTPSEVYKGRPKWVTCVAFAVAVLLMIACSISIGLLMGYTYCYMEFRSAIKSGNLTEAMNVIHITQLSHSDAANLTPESDNKTINGALMSSVFISRILGLGQALMKQQENLISWSHDEQSL